MNYYILTQGTKSQDFSFIIKNGVVIQPDDNARNFIRQLFEITETKGTEISIENSSAKIIKHTNNYLIEVLTTNTDRLNRKISVELLLENYSQDKFTENDLGKIYFLLYDEQILVDENNWKNILNKLNIDLIKYKQKKKLKLITTITLILITLFIIIKYILKWK